MLLEDVLRELLDADFTGPVALGGDFGSGKSTAVRAMRERFAGVDRLAFEDEDAADAPLRADVGVLVLYTSPLDPRRGASSRVVLTMSPWTRDDLIEYLLAAHPAETASVVARLPNVEVFDFFRGLPGLWRPVLDEMAADETVVATVKALLHVLAREWPDPETWRACADVSARRVFGENAWPDPRALHGDDAVAEQPYLRYEPVRLVLGVQRFFERLVNDKDPSVLASRVPPILLPRIGQDLRRQDAARELIARALVGSDAVLQSTAASVLNACDETAVKTELSKLDAKRIAEIQLRGASLDGVDLSGIEADGLHAPRASLARAKLDDAHVERFVADLAVLDEASLHEARLPNLSANEASLRAVDFTRAVMPGAKLVACNLRNASFHETILPRSVLAKANLAGARFFGADLSESDLTRASVDGALFRDVNFEGAQLDGVDCRRCALESTRFARAHLRHAKLDGVELPKADFTGADLTGAHLSGSRMREASFRDARLNEAGLADVDFEGADLRGADFTNASFHLGSSRSGLVFDVAPMEGTRTGYYTDEMTELTHKSPEEIRKANLRGADLRGAKIGQCAFHLVDLRDAQLDPAQRDHVRRCGAILRRRE